MCRHRRQVAFVATGPELFVVGRKRSCPNTSRTYWVAGGLRRVAECKTDSASEIPASSLLRRSSVQKRGRLFIAAGAALVVALALTACGSSGTSGGTATALFGTAAD